MKSKFLFSYRLTIFCENRKKRGPFLVVAPLSTLPNWLKEANRFCPSLDAFILYGRKDFRTELVNRLKNKVPHWDLCITNYETCRSMPRMFQRINWNFVVLDEGHKIKNEKTQTHKFISNIKSNHRLILTGTPLNVRIDFRNEIEMDFSRSCNQFSFSTILEQFARALGSTELSYTGCILECWWFWLMVRFQWLSTW